MTRGGRTQYTVLGVLTLGPRSGYDIKKFIEGSTNYFWQESFGQIYPALKKLAAAGLVRPCSRDGAGRPGRVVYEITGAGSSELRDWLVERPAPQVRRSELLLKLFFGTEMTTETSLQHVEGKREELHEELKAMRTILEWLDSELDTAAGYPFWRLAVRQGIVVNEALLEWCNEADHAIRKRGSPKAT